MSELQDSGHSIQYLNRKAGKLTGVVDVMSFDSNQIVLETTQGILTMKGQELHVSRLQLEQGEVDVEGRMDSLSYTEGGTFQKKKKGTLLKRMFQ